MTTTTTTTMATTTTIETTEPLTVITTTITTTIMVSTLDSDVLLSPDGTEEHTSFLYIALEKINGPYFGRQTS